MRVKELIEELLDRPMYEEVWFCTPDNEWVKIDKVAFNVPQNKVYLE